jgi:hypothetical protein
MLELENKATLHTDNRGSFMAVMAEPFESTNTGLLGRREDGIVGNIIVLALRF